LSLESNRRSDAEHALVGEQRRLTAGMDENDIRAGSPSPCPDERDQARQSLAGVDRVQGKASSAPASLMASMVAACGTP